MASAVTNTIAIVQARLRSTRLPGKVLELVDGIPMLRLVLERAAAARSVDAVVAALPAHSNEDELADAVASWGFPVVRGSATDVLERYVQAARQHDAAIVVRVTGDCPLIDPRLIDRTVEALQSAPHLVYAALGPSFPDGQNAEAMTIDALETAGAEATLPSHREHVTLYLRDHPERFPQVEIAHDVDLGHVRMSVDEPLDLDVVRALVSRLGSAPSVGFEALADVYVADVGHLNERISRDEGLWHSRNDDDVALVGMSHGRAESERWLERARSAIPCATQTLSKGIDQFVPGVSPVFLASGRGAHVTDVDGNTYIDYPMALGPIVLGYAYPRTIKAVTDELANGSIYSLPHPLEVEIAERLIELIPSAEMARFGKNGSDATTAAVRLARAATGRDVMLTCGYHGWHDWYVIQTARNAGVPGALAELVDSFAFNDLASLDAALARHDGSVAGVILEISVDEPAPGFLDGVVERVHRAGGLVIFDEIITGFRYAIGGAQERYGVTPDLTCLGKAMANGLPISAVVGRRDVMQEFENVFFSGTFGGETLSLAAARATIDEIASGRVIDHIWSTGATLRAGMQQIIDTSGLDVELLGVPARSGFVFRRDGEEWAALKGLFFQETVRRGVLFGGPVFISYSHRPSDIERTLEVMDEAFAVMRRAVEDDAVDVALEGLPPATVFRPVRT